jgi:hypothetical protein
MENKQTEKKQPEIFRKIPKFALYQTVSDGLLFVFGSIETPKLAVSV